MSYYRRSTIFEWTKIKKRKKRIGSAWCCFCQVEIKAGEEVMMKPDKNTYSHIGCWEKVREEALERSRR